MSFLLAQQTAQVQPSTNWVELFLQAGVAGGMLLWFMWRDNESRKAEALRRKEDAEKAKEDAQQIKGVENAIHRMARASLILVLSLKQADVTAKEKASELIKEIDDLK